VRIFIDATTPAPPLRVFGMGLVERLLRGVLEAGIAPIEVLVVQAPGGSPPAVPPALLARLPVRFERLPGPGVARLNAALRGGDPVLAMAADAVVDARLLGYLAHSSGSVAFVGGEGAGRAVVARLEPGVVCGGADLLSSVDALIESGDVRSGEDPEFPSYIPMLRRDLPAYAFRVGDEAAVRQGERFLFWSNYKGSTDFMTRYVYPPLVWLLVRPLARWRVHPNWVTGVDIAAAFAAVPFFAAGAWLPGLLLGYLMTVLDSVDGKLARLTFTSSRLGEVLDHGLDIVHPPIWYLAWGWALGGGAPGSLPFRAALWMLAIYVIDRVIAGVFKWRLGRSIHGYTPFDERMRTFISRRNVNLVFFTLALAIDAASPVDGWPAATFCWFAIVAWQALCLVFHLQRLGHFWHEGSRG